MTSQGFEIRFSCGHFYQQRKWSAEKNRQVFGRCFHPQGHGHDYRLLAETSDPTLALTLEAAMHELRKELDHKHLNFDFPEFRDQVPTSENLLLFCLDRLQKKLGKTAALNLQIWETPEIGASLQNHS